MKRLIKSYFVSFGRRIFFLKGCLQCKKIIFFPAIYIFVLINSKFVRKLNFY